MVRWHDGIERTPHADNLEPDGRPNSTPHRCFSSLLYLNDDYDGGETFLPGYGVRLRPEAGTLILFGAAAVRIPLTTIGLLQYLAPILQFAIGVGIRGEDMPASRWAGFGLVWIAVALFTWDSVRARRLAPVAVARA